MASFYDFSANVLRDEHWYIFDALSCV